MLTFRHRGNFNNLERFLNKISNNGHLNSLAEYGQMGVNALSAATPVDSGKTASSWTYEIERNGETTTLSWLNTNRVDGVNIAIILQYGHGTGTGGYVKGQNYINPAIQPVFDKIAEGVWKEVVE